jgi:hypothetical protein
MEGAGMAGLSYYASNDEDPYVLIKDEVLLIILQHFYQFLTRWQL